MGQKIGKASFEEDAKPFLNLPAPAINAVWTKFNLSAEAWGLRTAGFTNICKPLAPYMGVDDAIMDEKALALFKLLDTDMNDVVDALEFMATLSMVSAMEPADKVKFIYTVYDFSESGSLLVDEITMAVKSTVEGLCKVSKLPPPSVAQFEDLAKLAFKSTGKDHSETKLTLAEFMSYADASPTTASWVAHFDDIPDAAEVAPPLAEDKSFALPAFPARSTLEARVLEGLPLDAAAGGAWHKAPAASASGEIDAATGEPMMDAGSPSFEAVTEFLKPAERVKTLATAPDSQLSLEWVYGVSTLCRNHVAYGSDGSILLAAGGVGVQYRFPDAEVEGREAATQQLFLGHKDLLTALAVSSDGKTVATADCSAPAPKVMVWEYGGSGLVLKKILAGFKAPVFSLDFSPGGGKKLLSVTKDANFTVAVHDVASGLRLFNAAAAVPEGVLGAKWCASPPGSASAGSFALATAKGIVFYAESGLTYEARKGVAGAKAKAEALVSLQAMGGAETMAAGGQAGTLYKYEGRNVSECAAAHNGPVTALAFIEASRNTAGADGDRLFSGSADASIKIWGPNLEPIATIDLMALGESLGRGVLSLDVAAATGGDKLLVATTGAEVWELTAVAPAPAEGEEEEAPAEDGEEGAAPTVRGPGQTLHPETGWLFNGHFGGGALAALAASPTEAVFASGGADGTLRLYSSEAHAVTKVHQLSTAAPLTCAAYSPDGSTLAVGVGGGVDVLDPSDLATRKARLPAESEGDDAAASAKRELVKLMRWSADGSLLMVLDAAKVVTLYQEGAWTAKQSFDLSKATPAAINGLDLSEDGAFLQVGTDNMELLYYSVETGEACAEGFAALKAAGTRVVTSGTSGSKIAFEKQTAYPPHCAPGDVVSSAVSGGDAGVNKLTLCADRFGAMHLFNYPAASATGFASWQAHTPSSANPGAAFVAGDAHVVSAGAEDLTVLQWKLEVDEQVDEPKEPEVAEPEPEDEDNPPEKVLQDEEDGPTEDFAEGAALSDAGKAPLFHALVNADAAAARALAAPAAPSSLSSEEGADAEAAAAAAAASSSDNDDPFAASKALFAGAVAPEEAGAAGVDPPADGLSLDWVHGCSSGGLRGGVRYNSAGEVVYAAAALPVVFNKTEVTQRYVAGHSDAVTCLAMHPGGAFVATGQKGAAPCVVVADSLTGVVVGKFSPGEEGNGDATAYCAISAVTFSADGKLLAFTAQDEGANTLFVYNWQEGALKAKVASGALKVMALAFSPDSQTLLSCGVDHFSLWGVGGRGISKRRGIFGPSAVKQTLLSCCWVPATGEDGATPAFAVLGAADGSLYKLEGRTVGEALDKVHEGGVAALFAYAPFGEEGDGHCLASGGADGVVKLWGAELGEPKLEINLRQAKYGVYKWAVKSVCLNKDGRKVLVGTAGSEIYEFSATEEAVDMNDGPLVTGHCRGKLPAVAAHPILPEYATAGDDRTLRLWSIEERKLSRMLRLGDENEATSVAYRPDGHLIAVGLKSGTVLIVSTLKLILEVVKELKDTEAPITAVKFSPDGKVLAAATEAGEKSQVIFYDCLVTSEPGGSFSTKSTFELWDLSAATAKAPAADGDDEKKDPTEGMSKEEKKRYELEQAQMKELGQVKLDVDAFAKQMEARNADIVPEVTYLPTSPACLDFSEDSSFVQYATQQGLAYVGVETGEPMEEPEEAVRNESWKSYSCPMGWGVQGAYGPRAAPGDASTAAPSAVARSEDQTLLATVDGCGSLKLSSWPLPGAAPPAIDAAPTKTFRAHASGLSGVAFSVGDDFVLTTGADDRCVMQWARVRDDAAATATATAAAAATTEESAAAAAPGNSAVAGYDEVVAALAAAAGGAPTTAAVAPRPTEAKFVHGLSTFTGNVAYNADGAAIFAAGSLGVVYQKKQHSQLLFGGHGDSAVRVFAASPGGSLVATGDASGAIRVWDACTAEAVAGGKPFAALHSAAVAALSFSSDAKFLVSVGEDAQHTVALWTTPRGDWTDPTLVSKQASGTSPIYCAAWRAAGQTKEAVPFDFATGGAAGLCFWTVGGAGNLVGVKAVLGDVGVADAVTCAVAVANQWVAGGASGGVTVFEGKTAVKAMERVHAPAGAAENPTPVTDLRVTPNGTGCVSGGADGVVKVWDAVGKDGLAVVSEFSVAASASPRPIRSAVASVAVDAAFTKLLVVTQSAELLEIVRDSGSNVQLLCSHAGAGVTAPVKHPDAEQSDLFATGGGDGTVRVWSSSGNRAEAVLEVGAAVSALSFSPSGGALVAALSPSGAIIGVTVDCSSGSVVLEKNKMYCPSLTPVPMEVQISGDGSTLLVDGKYKTAKGEDEPDPKRGLAWAKPTTDLPVEADAATGCLFVY